MAKRAKRASPMVIRKKRKQIRPLRQAHGMKATVRRRKSDLSQAQRLTVKAAWDAEAKIWYTEDSSLPGLNLEAETLDQLRSQLPGAIEDLLEGEGKREVPFTLITPGLVKIPA
jgi:hypothetical protein